LFEEGVGVDLNPPVVCEIMPFHSVNAVCVIDLEEHNGASLVVKNGNVRYPALRSGPLGLDGRAEDNRNGEARSEGRVEAQ
jgi:hypothetical protein